MDSLARKRLFTYRPRKPVCWLKVCCTEKTVHQLTSKSGQLATSRLEQRTKAVVSTGQVGCSYFFKIVGVVVATVSWINRKVCKFLLTFGALVATIFFCFEEVSCFNSPALNSPRSVGVYRRKSRWNFYTKVSKKQLFFLLFQLFFFQCAICDIFCCFYGTV